MADIRRAAEETFDLIRDVVGSIADDTHEVYNDFFGPFDIIHEVSPIFPPSEGMVTVRRSVPEFVGAVVLYGDYVDRNGLIKRSPSSVHADTERLVGSRMKLGAERVLDEGYLLNLVGVPVVEIVEDRVGGRVTLVGAQINNALSLLQMASEADVTAVVARHGVDAATVESVQRAAEKLLTQAEEVALLEKTGVKHRVPLIANRKRSDPRIPAHLAERAERARAASLLRDGNTSRIPAHLLARAAEARRLSGLTDKQE